MIELTGAGAGVLALPCVELAKRDGIAVHVLSSFAPGAGTWVRGAPGESSPPSVSGITYTLDEVVFELHDIDDPGDAEPYLHALAAADVGCDTTIQARRGRTPPRLVCVVHEKDALLADEILASEVARVGVGRLASSLSMARVSVVGNGICEDGELSSRVAAAFEDAAGTPVWHARSGMRISSILPRIRAERVVAELHERLGLDR